MAAVDEQGVRQTGALGFVASALEVGETRARRITVEPQPFAARYSAARSGSVRSCRRRESLQAWDAWAASLPGGISRSPRMSA